MPHVEVVFCVYLISVCISTPAVTATRITPVCPKCAAIKKSGELSCCASGGAWFENCGTSGNSNTDHTWVEGMQACRDVVSLASGKAEPQFIISVHQTTSTQQLNEVEHQVIDSTLAAVYDVPMRNSKDNDQISHVAVFSSLLFIVVLNIYKY